MGFHGLRHASEWREGQATRLVDRNALTLEFLCGFGDVRVDFGTQLAFISGVEDEEGPSWRARKIRRRGQESSSWSLKIRATMAVACCQAASSAARCFRPVLVSA